MNRISVVSGAMLAAICTGPAAADLAGVYRDDLAATFEAHGAGIDSNQEESGGIWWDQLRLTIVWRDAMAPVGAVFIESVRFLSCDGQREVEVVGQEHRGGQIEGTSVEMAPDMLIPTPGRSWCAVEIDLSEQVEVTASLDGEEMLQILEVDSLFYQPSLDGQAAPVHCEGDVCIWASLGALQ